MPLRLAIPALILLLLGGVALAITLMQGDGELPGGASAPGRDPTAGAPIAGGGPDRHPAPVPTKNAPRAPEVRPYQVVDAADGTPCAGVVVRRVAGGGRVAVTDARGTFKSRETLDRLAFVFAGYLVELGSGKGPLVRLRRDDVTVPLRLRFEGQGTAPASVQLRLEALADPAPSAGTVPNERRQSTAFDQELDAAWQRHVLVCSVPGFEDLPHHLGLQSIMRTYTVAPEVTMRLVASGDYRLEAMSDAGEFAIRVIRVVNGSSEPVTVRLLPGASLEGIVRSGGSPVADAVVTVTSRALGAGRATTDASGQFRLAPLPDGIVKLRVEHALYDTVEVGPRRVDERWAIELRRRPVRGVRGIVRGRPQMRPVAGALVSLLAAGKNLGETRTGADGRFALDAPATRLDLVVVADGFARYVETVVPGEAPATYDLLPATPTARCNAGLTAVVRGRLVDAGGKPRARHPVEIVPPARVFTPPLGGRRIVTGGLLAPQMKVLSGPDGTFELECASGGVARVEAPGAVEGGVAVDVTVGTVRSGVEVRLQ